MSHATDAARRARRAAYMREWYARNREKVRAAQTATYQAQAGPPPEPRPCQQCGLVYAPKRRDGKRPSVYCSRKCKDDARNEAWKRALRDRKTGEGERQCPWCGDLLPPSMRSDAKFCSDGCNSRAHLTTRKFRRRIGQSEKRRATEELVSLAVIAERDGWRCQLCRRKVSPRCQHPDPSAPSLDHIVPVSRGGTHEPENLQLSHLRCNLSKRDGAANEQLRLLG